MADEPQANDAQTPEITIPGWNDDEARERIETMIAKKEQAAKEAGDNQAEQQPAQQTPDSGETDETGETGTQDPTARLRELQQQNQRLQQQIQQQQQPRMGLDPWNPQYVNQRAQQVQGQQNTNQPAELPDDEELEDMSRAQLMALMEERTNALLQQREQQLQAQIQQQKAQLQEFQGQQELERARREIPGWKNNEAEIAQFVQGLQQRQLDAKEIYALYEAAKGGAQQPAQTPAQQQTEKQQPAQPDAAAGSTHSAKPTPGASGMQRGGNRIMSLEEALMQATQQNEM